MSSWSESIARVTQAPGGDSITEGRGGLTRSIARFLGGAALPADIAAKLQKLQDQRDDAGGAVRTLNERVGELRDSRRELSGQLNYVELPPMMGGPMGDNSREAARLKAGIDTLSAELSRVEEKMAPRVEQFTALSRLVDRCEGYAARHGAALKLHRDPATAKKATPTVEAVEHVRQRFREVSAKIHEANSAPRTSGETKIVARDAIEQLSEKGRPDIFAMLDGDNSIRWPSSPLDVFVSVKGAESVARGDAPDALAILAWTHKAAMISAIEREIDEAADDENALTVEQRAARLKELSEELLRIEREECALIEQLGGVVTFRAETDVRCVLCVEGPPP